MIYETNLNRSSVGESAFEKAGIYSYPVKWIIIVKERGVNFLSSLNFYLQLCWRLLQLSLKKKVDFFCWSS